MADIPVRVVIKFDVVPDDIRKAARDVRDAIEKVQANINVLVSQPEVQKEVDKAAAGTTLTIKKVELSPQSVTDVQNQANVALANVLMRVNLDAKSVAKQADIALANVLMKVNLDGNSLKNQADIALANILLKVKLDKQSLNVANEQIVGSLPEAIAGALPGAIGKSIAGSLPGAIGKALAGSLGGAVGGGGGAAAAANNPSRIRNSDEEFNKALLRRLNAEDDGTRALIRVDRARQRATERLVAQITQLQDTEKVFLALQGLGGSASSASAGLKSTRILIDQLNNQLKSAIKTNPDRNKLGEASPVGFGGFHRQFNTNDLGLGKARLIRDTEGNAIGSTPLELPGKGQIDSEFARLRKAAALTSDQLEQIGKAVAAGDLNGITTKLLNTEAVLTGINSDTAATKLRQIRIANKQEAEEEALQRATSKLTNSRLDAANSLTRNKEGTTGTGATLASFGGDLRSATAARERFIQLLGQQTNAVDKANASFKVEGGVMAKTTTLIGGLNDKLNVGTAAAEEFGKASAAAAERFLQWAAPATFIFNALNLLSQATSKIIDLNEAATNLAISNLFGDTSDNMDKLGNASQEVASRMQQIIGVSEQTGISLSKVGEALLEIERINRGSTGLDPGNFQDAVTSLLQVEGAAISAVDAVRFLNSTLEQFNLTGADAVSVSAKLFEVSLESSFNVSQLANAVARLGSAFTTLQNLRIDQVIGLVGTAASRTGADVGRLSTALRQVSTLAVANADKIERLTGIKIAVDGGELQDFNQIVELLERINSLRGTTAQRDLISLIADRRNIADVAALAGAARELRKELGLTTSDQELAAAASDRVRKLRAADEVATEKLTARIEKLQTAVVSLVNESGMEQFLGTVIDNSRRFAETLKDVVGFASALLPLLKAIVAVRVLQFAGGFAKGAVEGITGTSARSQARDNTFRAVQEGRALDAIAHSVEAGIIPRKQALAIQEKTVNLTLRQATVESELNTLHAGLNANQKAFLAGEAKKLDLNSKEQVAVNRIGILRAEQVAITNDQLRVQNILNNAIKTGSDNQQRAVVKARSSIAGIFGGAAGIAGAIALSFGNVIGNSITEANDKARAELKKVDIAQEVIGGLFKGAGAGAAAGSFISPGFGSAIGAAIGAGIGGVTAFANARKENEEIAKKSAERLKTEQLAEEAFQRQLAIIREQRNARLRASNEQDNASRNLIRFESEIAQLELQINKAGAERAEQLGLTAKLQEKQTSLIRTQEQLALREKAITEERIQFEEDIVKIREKGSRIINALALVEKARVQIAQRAGQVNESAEIQVKFNKDSVNAQIQAVQEEINRVTIEISRFNADSGRGQEARRAAKTRERLEQQVADIQLAGAQKEFELRTAALDIATKEAETQIKAWEQSASAVANAFKEVVGVQLKLVDVISKSSSFLIEAASVSSEKILTAIEATGATGGKLQQKVAQQQVELARQQLTIFGAAASEQISILGSISTASISELDANANKAAENFAALSIKVSSLGSTVDKATLLELSIAEANLNQAKIEIDTRQSVISQLTQIGQQEVGLIRNVITARQAELKAIQEREREQAQLGQKLLETPEVIAKELRSVLTAQKFLGGITGSAADQISQIGGRVNALQTQKGGSAALQEVLAGLKAAQDLSIRISDAFTPEKLINVFSRLQFLNASDVQPLIDEENNVRSEIGKLQDSLVDKLNGLASLQEQQRALVEAQVTLANKALESAEKREVNQEKVAITALQQQATANSIFIEVASNISQLGNTLDIQINLLRNLDFTTGDKAIEGQLAGLRPIIEELVNANTDVRNARQQEFRKNRLETPKTFSSTEQVIGFAKELGAEIKTLTGASNLDIASRLQQIFKERGINPEKRGLNQTAFDSISALQEILVESQTALLNDLNKLKTPGQAFTVENQKTKDALLQGERNNDLLGAIEGEIARLTELLGPNIDFSRRPASEQPTAQASEALTFLEDFLKTKESEDERRANELIAELKNGQKRNEEAINRLKDSGFGETRPPPKGGRPPKGAAQFGETDETAVGNSVSTAIDAATNRMSTVADKLATSQIGVEFGKLEIQISANVVQQIQDGGFADALREALAGTELESQVETIKIAVIDVIKQLGSTNPPLLIRSESIEALDNQEE